MLASGGFLANLIGHILGRGGPSGAKGNFGGPHRSDISVVESPCRSAFGCL